MFKILSLGPGRRGFHELFTCRLYQAAQNGEPDVEKIYRKFKKDLRKALGDKSYLENVEFLLNIEFHSTIRNKFSNVVLDEYQGGEFKVAGVERYERDVRDLNELSKKMKCPVNVLSNDFEEYIDSNSQEYDMILGGHILNLHTNFNLISKMCKVAPTMVFWEYEYEIKKMYIPKLKKELRKIKIKNQNLIKKLYTNLKEYSRMRKATDHQLIKEMFDYVGDGRYQVTVEYGESNDCLIKAKRNR